MKKIIYIIGLMLLTSCSIGNSSLNSANSTQDSNSTNNSSDISSSTDEKEKITNFAFDEPFLNLFDINNKVLINLKISNEQLKLINSDNKYYTENGSKSPIYRMADMNIKIYSPEALLFEQDFEEVGIRMKGNTSRRDFVDEDGNITNLVHFKLDFQQTFDSDKTMLNNDGMYYYPNKKQWTDSEKKQRKSRTLLGLSKLDMKWNKNFDNSYIRDYYANKLFETSELLAPKTNLANVIRINENNKNTNLGIFTIYEPIDEKFLAKRLKKQYLGGDLYKLSWGADFKQFSNYGIEDENKKEFPIYDLKTNKKTSSHLALKNFIDLVNKLDIENSLLLSYFFTQESIAYIVGSADDLRNNNNNTYIYFLPTNNKMIIIPYDIDRAFGIAKEWNPTKSCMTELSPFSREMAGGTGSVNKFYQLTTTDRAESKYLNLYKNELMQLFNNSLINSHIFDETFKIAKANYEDIVVDNNIAYASFNNDKQTIKDSTEVNIDFTTYLNLKIETLKKALNL